MQEHELGWPVGLGPRLVPSAFQISIWMRASSFTRSWASSGELGHGGSLFLYSSFPCAPPPPQLLLLPALPDSPLGAGYLLSAEN